MFQTFLDLRSERIPSCFRGVELRGKASGRFENGHFSGSLDKAGKGSQTTIR